MPGRFVRSVRIDTYYFKLLDAIVTELNSEVIAWLELAEIFKDAWSVYTLNMPVDDAQTGLAGYCSADEPAGHMYIVWCCHSAILIDSYLLDKPTSINTWYIDLAWLVGRHEVIALVIDWCFVGLGNRVRNCFVAIR